MRIGMIHHRKTGKGKEIPTGGATVNLDNLCENLLKRGHEIHIFLPDKSKIEDKRFRLHYLYTPVFWPFKRYKHMMLALIYNFRTFFYGFDKYNIDCLHLSTPALVRSKTKIIYSAFSILKNDLRATRDSMKTPLMKLFYSIGIIVFSFLEKKTLLRADKIVCQTSQQKNELIEAYDLNEDKIVVIPNAVDINFNLNYDTEVEKKYLKNKNEKIILFVGRGDSERKGLKYLIDAFNSLKKEGITNIKLICVGPGTEKINEENIIEIGSVKREHLPYYYSISDIFVLPSLYEPQATVVLEAMVFKKPVIGTNAGGTPHMVRDGENGFLVPPKNSEKIAEKLKILLKDDELSKKMGEKGRKIVEEEYSWEIIVKKIEEVYKN